MSEKKSNKYRIDHPGFSIEINQHSGFCFGVVNAIEKAESNIESNDKLYCVGSIVHNSQEVKRLTQKGLQTININDIEKLKNKTILFRAHGEPPESYNKLKNTNNTLIDATCPVVLKIQKRIKKAWIESKKEQGQIVIYGTNNHAELIGLLGQTNFEAIHIENESDLDKIDFNKPIELFSQTTKSVANYEKIASIIKNNAKSRLKVNDTICRQVANREKQLAEFAINFEKVFFVGDPNSSNSKVLFKACKTVNANTEFISNEKDLNPNQISTYKAFGICGATSTPQWLMELIAKKIEQIKLNN